MFDYTQMAETLKVLGHPVRLRIINELIGSDKTVSELWHSVGLPQSLVSQHLSVLRHSGIIKSVRKGRSVYYSVANPIAIRILNLIQK
ncbi:MAG: ArsR/SmtB family transcription factor [Candidatus Kryptonium sp.]